MELDVPVGESTNAALGTVLASAGPCRLLLATLLENDSNVSIDPLSTMVELGLPEALLAEGLDVGRRVLPGSSSAAWLLEVFLIVVEGAALSFSVAIDVC